MEKYNIIFLSEAYFDLEEIHKYIERDNSEIATKYVNSIIESISKLSTFPFLGNEVPKKIVPFGDFRKIIVDHYYIFYRVENNEILIYRIIHGKRKLNNIIKYL